MGKLFYLNFAVFQSGCISLVMLSYTKLKLHTNYIHYPTITFNTNEQLLNCVEVGVFLLTITNLN